MIGGARTFLIALLAISIAGCAATTTTPPSLPSAPKPGGGPLIVSPHSPYAIALGPDKNIWFTEYEGDSIGMMTPAGEVMRFPIAPDGIAERLTGGGGRIQRILVVPRGRGGGLARALQAAGGPGTVVWSTGTETRASRSTISL